MTSDAASPSTRPRALFGPVLTAMVTPFDDNGDLDLDRAQNLARHLVANGNDGVVVAGTTGESPTISYDEQRELTVAVREAIPDHTLVAGAGSNDLRTAIKNTHMANEAGADGILAVTPYYNRPSQAGIEAHFRASAAETDLPVILYDIPIRTGRKISDEVLLRLAEVDNIVAVKDAAGNPGASARIIAKTDLQYYSGDDGLTLPLLAVGAVGVIGVATHWVGREMADMIAAYTDGKVAEAQRLNALMLPSFAYETGDLAPNPVPTKALMNLIGVPVGHCRLPMGPAPDNQDDLARAVLADLGRSVS
ncbi:MAG: 4-hydroxy-tetrahydrodipicolinate synthase [Acidimicrobiia bacterium]|nr:4-hydroxy-tetrahydrodipicolinate synthase [Acidimicrobiia bacterium]